MAKDYIKIIDNFLSPKIEDFLVNLHTYGGFPWYFNPSTIGPDAEARGNALDTSQFVHQSYDTNAGGVTSEAHKEYDPILNALINANHLPKEYKISRCKSNFTYNTTGYQKQNHQPIHHDHPLPLHYSVLYYVNDSDGDTLFFSYEEKDKIVERVSPKKGRAIIFNSDRFHAGCNPIDSPYRIVVNFILILDKPLES